MCVCTKQYDWFVLPHLAFTDGGATIKVIKTQWKHTDQEGYLLSWEPEISLISLAGSRNVFDKPRTKKLFHKLTLQERSQ